MIPLPLDRLDTLPALFSSEVQSLIQPQFLLLSRVLTLKQGRSIAGYTLESQHHPSPTPTSRLVCNNSDCSSEYLFSSSFEPDPAVSTFTDFDSSPAHSNPVRCIGHYSAFQMRKWSPS